MPRQVWFRAPTQLKDSVASVVAAAGIAERPRSFGIIPEDETYVNRMDKVRKQIDGRHA
jgi:hypothetical protein